ncbi:MAG: hypothetical protein IJE53_07025 [Bacilli bacterium]|nr:hypothetical protein [Bacilli bacterium]
MTDFDKLFEGDIDRKFFYTDYPGDKMMVGKISLDNAKARMSKNEYYTLVTYTYGEELPERYVPLEGLQSDDGTLFATLNPNHHIWNICRDGGIQRISRLPDLENGSPNYLLGPGPDTVALYDMIMDQYAEVTGKDSPVVETGKGK